MFRKILVGFDGSEHAGDALALAGLLAQVTGASLTLVCAVRNAPAYFPLERLEDEFRDEANGVLHGAAADLPSGVDHDSKVVMGLSPARALAELAEAEDADLIVVGSSHRSALGRVLAGSVGQQVIDGAPCAVAIAPAGFREQAKPRLEVIGAGLDGEPQSLGALLAAESLASAAGGSLRLFSVIAPTDLYVPQGSSADVYEAIEAAARQHAHGVVDDAIASLTADVPVVREIVEGPIGPALEAAAEAADIDLLVVGSRGFGPVRRVLLGSVSSQLVTASPCPVLIVPRVGERSAAASPTDVAEPGREMTLSEIGRVS
jgi:nucleotide-binding universal stress UspA family protein